MGCVYQRGQVLWFNYAGPDGRRVQMSSGLGLAQRDQAVEMLAALEAQSRLPVLQLSVLPPPPLAGVYFLLRRAPVPMVKIGVSERSIKARIKALQTSSPELLFLVAWYVGDSFDEAEEHDRWSALRVRGNSEWFFFKGALKRYVTELARTPGARRAA